MNKILIIEDDKEMCRELSDILRDEGYRVNSVSNGIEGINAINGGGYNLVLLDLKLPGLTGFEILEKTGNRMAGLKIIVLTGRPLLKDSDECISGINEEEEALLKKADLVVNKPFDVENILSKINSLLKI